MILLALGAIICMAAASAGLVIEANYDGDGTIDMRADTGIGISTVRGDGASTIMLSAGGGTSWVGVEALGFNWAVGMTGISGPMQTVQMRDSTEVSAQMLIDEDKTFAEFHGSGEFRHGVYVTNPDRIPCGKYLRPDKVLEVIAQGRIDMNTTVVNDTTTGYESMED